MRSIFRNWPALFALLIGAAALAAPADAAQYTCRVPRALLCEGCAQQIAISLQADGGCRISFTPGAGAAASGGAAASSQLEFQVQSAPVYVAPHVAAYRPRRFASTRPAPKSRCFIFNANEYCE